MYVALSSNTGEEHITCAIRCYGELYGMKTNCLHYLMACQLWRIVVSHNFSSPLEPNHETSINHVLKVHCCLRINLQSPQLTWKVLCHLELLHFQFWQQKYETTEIRTHTNLQLSFLTSCVVDCIPIIQFFLAIFEFYFKRETTSAVIQERTF